MAGTATTESAAREITVQATGIDPMLGGSVAFVWGRLKACDHMVDQRTGEEIAWAHIATMGSTIGVKVNMGSEVFRKLQSLPVGTMVFLKQPIEYVTRNGSKGYKNSGPCEIVSFKTKP